MSTEPVDDADDTDGEPVTDDDAYADEDAERLTAFVLDVLGPTLAWWRVEAGRRLGVDAPSLTCLELARRHGTVSPALIAERTGMTRSAVSKMLRRLRDAGEVELHGGELRGQPLEVVLRPLAVRDAELERLRREVCDRLRWAARTELAERAEALRLLREVATSLHVAATHSADEAAEARRAAARRAAARERAAERERWMAG